MKSKLVIIAFVLAVLPILAAIAGYPPYKLRYIDRCFSLAGAVIAFVAIYKDTSGSKLPYIIFIFCLSLFLVTKLPQMSCELDTSSIALSLDSIANALRR